MNTSIILIVILCLLALGYLFLRGIGRHSKHALINSVSYGESKRKELLEDTIKVLYRAEGKGEYNLKSLSSQLGISTCRQQKILNILRDRNFISHDSIKLTAAGEDYARKIIRLHRLYERYLAEQSGHNPKDWHRLAERMEHRLDDEDVEKITRILRNPIYDPHGDLISDERVASSDTKNEVSLDRVQKGYRCEVLRIDDHNTEAYKRFTEIGVYPHTVIFLEESSPHSEKYSVMIEGERYTLNQNEASAVEVEALSTTPEDGTLRTDSIRLTLLPSGSEAEITGLSPGCKGPARRRLLDLGFVKGSTVSIDLKSPMGNPTAYVIRGTAIALRRDQAKYILINPRTIKTFV